MNKKKYFIFSETGKILNFKRFNIEKLRNFNKK
jgi:hypothetical protein